MPQSYCSAIASPWSEKRPSRCGHTLSNCTLERGKPMDSSCSHTHNMWISHRVTQTYQHACARVCVCERLTTRVVNLPEVAALLEQG